MWLFPCRAGAKTPAHKGWQQEATRDPDQLRAWFATPSALNIGIFTGRFGDDAALLVVDIDRRPGKDGETALFDLNLEGYDLPATLETQTPNGRHLFFTVPQPVSGSDKPDLPTGAEVRARHQPRKLQSPF
jgi:hypothetical protein